MLPYSNCQDHQTGKQKAGRERTGGAGAGGAAGHTSDTDDKSAGGGVGSGHSMDDQDVVGGCGVVEGFPGVHRDDTCQAVDDKVGVGITG